MKPTEQPTLSDGVVWLTPFTEQDGVAIGDFNLDDEHRRWFDQPPVDPDPAGRRRHGEMVARRWLAQWSTGEALAFAVRTAPNTEAIGMTELQPRPGRAANISYSIVPTERRRGYGARAVRLLAHAASDTFGFERVELRCDVDNVASARTAERAGFVLQRIESGSGTFDHVAEWIDQPRDERVYLMERTRDDGLRSRSVTDAAASTDRTLEVATVAFYVSITLAAELAAASSSVSEAVVVGGMWGTAIGLALAHWYASTLTRALARGSIHRADAKEGLREVGVAMAIVASLTVPFVLFTASTALIVSRWAVIMGTASIAYVIARRDGATRRNAALQGLVVVAIGVTVIQLKSFLSHS
jgi:RimJ/RimL family protein N-acetyltransferase